ncbi:MAG: SoxR reducing system RseC family protein [Woeseiaceae bacterium]|jgi:positive regulator of sigma E activity|nr:SoxR reducing system RseC family protein [Woeseiaceae bacterium]
MTAEAVRGCVESLTTVDATLLADVAVDAASACARCRSGRGCGAGVFTGAPRRRVLRLPVPPGARIEVGAEVTVRIPGESLLRATLLAYGLPLAGLLCGGVAGFALDGGDVVAALAAAAGLAVGAVAARAQAQRRCWHDEAASMLTLEAGSP